MKHSIGFGVFAFNKKEGFVIASKNKTLMETLIDAGYPREEMYHHCSDLYIFWTPTTVRIVNRWYKERGLNRALFVTSFEDQITGRLMLDCAFQYDPYWNEAAKRKEKEDAISEKNS